MLLHGLLSAACGTGAAPGAAKAGRGGGSASTAADRGLVEEPWMALPDAELTAQQKATKAEFVKKLQVRCRSCIGALCIPRCCQAPSSRSSPRLSRQDSEGWLLLLHVWAYTAHCPASLTRAEHVATECMQWAACTHGSLLDLSQCAAPLQA